VGVEGQRVRFHSLAANEPHRLAHLLDEVSQSMPAGQIGEERDVCRTDCQSVGDGMAFRPTLFAAERPR
jgi:hypothetical protein